VTSLKQAMLREITRHYFESGDFNGSPLIQLAGTSQNWLRTLRALVREGRVSVVFGDIHPNAHIKALPSESTEKQLEKLRADGLDLFHVCAYPTEVQLSKVVGPGEYADRPFTRRLALGAPQLAYESFDLSILEYYRNDPRYHYTNDDISGTISYTEDAHPPEGRDAVVLQTFGFSYDKKFNRAVAVFLRYLADLTPEHQQVWNARILSGDYRLHPDYFRNSILGEWAKAISVFDAFGLELHHINEMSRLMGRAPLFRREFREGDKPRELSFLIRPTLREFNAFVLVLDKEMSENINLAFFRGEVPHEVERERSDSKIVVQSKGTVQILQDWLKKSFRPADPEPLDKMLKTFREVRNLRQRPAHALEEDRFDLDLFREQRELMIRAYDSVRTLRLLLANHPKARHYKVEDWLQSGTIWTY
jgi:hypothetical protein